MFGFRRLVHHYVRWCCERRDRVGCLRLIRKYGFKAAGLALVMQEDHGDDPNGLLARMTLRNLALQILQKTVREMIKRTLAAGIFLIARAAVRTNEFNLVLLRIAVQSGPTRAAHAYSFNNSALHRIYPLQLHVHKA